MKITIDGRPIEFEGSPTILEVARAHGISIPSLCDHPRLEPFAACRVCLVEVVGRKFPAPACSTPAEDGMTVLTATPEIATHRRRTLELILAEHPSSCLVCDERNSCEEYKSTLHKTGEINGCVFCPANGRCGLQRVVAEIGVERVHFPTKRRPGGVRRDDPFIDRDNSLCILCGRCVRICEEVRGASVLTFVGRGSETVIGTALDRRLLDSGCRFCGACVDVCPTAALAERAVRYGRLPEREIDAICVFCGQGCRLKVGVGKDGIVGAVPDPDGPANRGQACVRGRFLARFAVENPERIARPMIRRDGRLEETTWEEALDDAAERLSAAGPGRAAAALSGQVSCEDLFALHKFASEVLGAERIDGPWTGSAAARLRSLARSKGAAVSLNFRFDDIARAGTIVFLGKDAAVSQPMVGVALAEAARRGAEVVASGLDDDPRTVLRNGRKPGLILFEPEILGTPEGRSRLETLLREAAASGGRVIALDGEADIRGGLEIFGAFPSGLKRAGKPRVLYIAGGYPKIDRGEAELLIVQGSYMDANAAAADIVFPEAAAFEAEGTFVNVEGRAQLSRQAVEPRGEARPGWIIAAELARRLGKSGFDWASAGDVRRDIAATIPSLSAIGADEFPAEGVFVDESASPESRPVSPAKPCSREADDYKGLDMALKNKSLRLIRGK